MTSSGEFAYPISADGYETEFGLTKREAFAKAALQGLLAGLGTLRKEGFRDADISEFAVIQADALIKALTDTDRNFGKKITPGRYKTRDGREARVYATDGGGPRPIHGAVFHEGEWHQSCWSSEGVVDYYMPAGSNPCNTDLVIPTSAA